MTRRLVAVLSFERVPVGRKSLITFFELYAIYGSFWVLIVWIRLRYSLLESWEVLVFRLRACKQALSGPQVPMLHQDPYTDLALRCQQQPWTNVQRSTRLGP